MRDYSKASPKFWTDHHGRVWRVPQIKGRLKFAIPSHAALRSFVIARDGGKCVDCGCNDEQRLVADHVVSRRNGGSHHPDNLRCRCNRCNARKSALVDARGAA